MNYERGTMTIQAATHAATQLTFPAPFERATRQVVGLTCALVLFGCGQPPSPGTAPAPNASHDTKGETALSAASSDEDLFNRWQDAIEKQVEADARAGVTRTFKNEDEARQFLFSLTPAGFRPRPEYFGALAGPAAGDVESFAKRMAAYAQAHPAEVERRITAFMARLEPVLEQISTNVQKQFPSASSSIRWVNDPKAALADAKQRQRATLMVFCAEWDMACKQLDRDFADASVQKALGERFVAARIDMTDDEAPEVKKHMQAFNIKGLPTLLVFDKGGREVGRQLGFVDVAGLQSLLARAK